MGQETYLTDAEIKLIVIGHFAECISKRLDMGTDEAMFGLFRKIEQAAIGAYKNLSKENRVEH